jgi:hypothetical protein
MSEDRYREWDAAYVLGGLSVEERHEYEAHLTECRDCSEAVAELAGLPGVLSRLDGPTAVAIRDLPADVDLAPARSNDVVGRLARRVGRRRRATRFAVAASVLAALAGGGAAGAALTAPVPPAAAHVLQMHPVGGSAVTARLAVTSAAWGTRFDWSCRYPSDRFTGTRYDLVVTTREGTTSTVATWSASGTGARNLSAVTSLRSDDIRSVAIRVPGLAHPLAETDL